MKKIKLRRSIVLTAAALAAIGAVATFAPQTLAQQRIGGDGRLMDANNRVGSGGFNDSSSAALPPGVFGNAIVTHDVSGGKGFQGKIPYFAPGAFEGNLPGGFVDNFVGSSTNVQTNGTIVNNAQNVHLFVGDSTGINAPAGFVSTGAQPGYIPNSTSTGQALTSDTRLGVPESSPTSSIIPSAIFQTAGASAGGGQSAYVAASPLFGVKTIQTSQQNDGTSAAISGQSLNSAIGSGDRVDLSETDQTALASASNPNLSSSLNGSALGTNGLGLNGLGTPPGVSSFATPQTNSPNGPNASSNQQQPLGPPGSQNPSAQTSNLQNATASGSSDNTNGLNGQSLNGNTLNGNNGALNAQVNAQVAAAVPSGMPLNASITASPLSGNLQTGESSSTDVYSPTSRQPNSAYQRMLLRFKALNPNAPLNPVQQNLLYQSKLQDLKAAAANTNKPGINGPTPSIPTNAGPNNSSFTGTPRVGGVAEAPAAGGAGGIAGQTLGQTPGQTPGEASGESPSGHLHSGLVIPQQVNPDKSPVPISSFSTDESSASTKEMLKKAEDLMKDGKFTSALEQYDLIEQQTPSQPYIELARANAELGASYYGLAQTHLRDAFMSNQALLSAQLDLHSLLGEDKLQYLVKDLKEIAQANPSESRPVFLLAYICYNTNNARGAAAYLDLAQKREGKPDPFFELLKKNWDLPDISGDNGADNLNK